jgi:hypothetical protein
MMATAVVDIGEKGPETGFCARGSAGPRRMGQTPIEDGGWGAGPIQAGDRNLFAQNLAPGSFEH